ncbi:hypothetical protein [Kutzneria sp. CA-103260]|uniref:hypothetical protein n=1 Tax=Kutzneria sp. CA-103260 TaxID=2802641 RepID=UPI001BAD0460|nr:hypothetical protein [Kutzneria sp. CA-103260]QUQ70449.1 Type-2 restriction enzyme BglII [Kutzneria sp. CA-103260]
MFYESTDFNGAAEYFQTLGAASWSEIDEVINQVEIQLQPSGQKGKTGTPIFDPKATNAKLTINALKKGWKKVPVPDSLKEFGADWDAGKGSVLVEWQFSNYPFLWNNVIRSEAVYSSKQALSGMLPIGALIIVTKSGSFPASNSTLYYEQAKAQLNTVTSLGVFDIPIRLVGLTIPPGTTQVQVKWNTYAERYGRDVLDTEVRTFDIRWNKPAQYGNRVAIFSTPSNGLF